MSLEVLIECFIAKARNDSSGFAVWFLPRSNVPMAVVQHEEIERISDLSQLHDRSGFVMAPFFVSKQNPILLLSPKGLLQGEDEIARYVGDSNESYDFTNSSSDENFVETPKQEFISQCSNAIELIRKGEMDKVVLSRQKFMRRQDSQPSPGRLLLLLKANHPAAFNSLFYTPATGWWMGGSPELLLRGSAGEYETMALAGTRAHFAQTSTSPWPEKEQLEQKFVSDYVIEKLRAGGITDIRCSVPFTRRAGIIEHICTEISFKSGNAAKLLQALHPTPAVCGMPADIANDFILKTEKHNRAYYSGFLGMLNINGQTDVYVNLRCMKLLDEGNLLYAGAGITAGSEPEREWMETEMKMAGMGRIE
jgi:isochorismate synthase